MAKLHCTIVLENVYSKMSDLVYVNVCIYMHACVCVCICVGEWRSKLIASKLCLVMLLIVLNWCSYVCVGVHVSYRRVVTCRLNHLT